MWSRSSLMSDGVRETEEVARRALGLSELYFSRPSEASL